MHITKKLFIVYYLRKIFSGYYADVDEDCNIFHVCYPVVGVEGEEEMFHWSFICPNHTIFDQVGLVVIGLNKSLNYYFLIKFR